mgnify:CR=1 FL=1
MKHSKTKNTFEELDKSFNTKEITKALESNLKKTQEERQLPAVDMSDEDKQALIVKQQEEDLQYARMMLKQADVFILLAVGISFAVSGFLWFSGQREEGLFTAVWVPSILCFGIYFKLIVIGAKQK